uniref:alpha-N-acetylgalactosaminide alpha-2,6-sialyltransferase n=1 Tax=Xenopus tropicalis TaxID=8364 RepID=A0A803KFD5_XENTR
MVGLPLGQCLSACPIPRECHCPSSVTSNARHSDWLSPIFLPKIKIFMDNSDFSNEIWDRLQHFIPPFGWMELNYTVVKDVVSALPPLPDQQILQAAQKPQDPQCFSCAVVGNGGILNGSGVGREIDSHAYVFRVNGAVIKGFEDDVGSRTSFYGFTAYTMLASLSDTQLKKRGFSKIPKDNGWGPTGFFPSIPAAQSVPAPDTNMCFMSHRFAHGDILKTHRWMAYRPSTGALLLLTALHLCDKVSAYGFMTDDFYKYSDHYYDVKSSPIKFYANHDFRLEKHLWKHLNVHMFTGSSGAGRAVVPRGWDLFI